MQPLHVGVDCMRLLVEDVIQSTVHGFSGAGPSSTGRRRSSSFNMSPLTLTARPSARVTCVRNARITPMSIVSRHSLNRSYFRAASTARTLLRRTRSFSLGSFSEIRTSSSIRSTRVRMLRGMMQSATSLQLGPSHSQRSAS